ncbi:hypothetical protein BDQ17DRAFT_313518 [Cyathus striatus]|nr:hypothetical protein BDQ17DRAFT_313518 [Cyathus striatus]
MRWGRSNVNITQTITITKSKQNENLCMNRRIMILTPASHTTRHTPQALKSLTCHTCYAYVSFSTCCCCCGWSYDQVESNMAGVGIMWTGARTWCLGCDSRASGEPEYDVLPVFLPLHPPSSQVSEATVSQDQQALLVWRNTSLQSYYIPENYLHVSRRVQMRDGLRKWSNEVLHCCEGIDRVRW